MQSCILRRSNQFSIEERIEISQNQNHNLHQFDELVEFAIHALQRHLLAWFTNLD